MVQEQFQPIPRLFGHHHLLWLDCLQRVEDGEIKRLMGLMPPGAGKTVYTSVVFPTHFLGRFPGKSIILTSYGSDLPRKSGRKARTIVRQPLYRRIFSCDLNPESQAVDEWSLTNGSEYMAAGILAGIVGNRADGIVWDDIIKGREAADSEVQRTKTWDAYLDDLKSRKKPGAWEIAINCLTGDTQVTMGDGTRKALSEIRPGDEVLSWKDGKGVVRKVLNWANQGLDDVLQIRTGGSVVRGNAKHPFLVQDADGFKWVLAGELKKGDLLVTNSWGSERTTNEFFLRSITSIESVGKHEVFDIQVEDAENFIADGVVVSNTRWHEDDPAGRILPKDYNGESGWLKGRDGNDWYVICIPAIAERNDDVLGRKPGERLWPEWFGPDHFDQYMGNARTWNALYQQRPAPESGDFFKSEWLIPYDKMPDRETMHIYGASDYAVTEGRNDYTVHVVVGVDPDGHLYLLDLWRAQVGTDKWIESFTDLVAKWKPMGWAEENGQIRSGVGPFLTKRLAERQLYIARAQFPTKGDKSIRAQSIRGRMAMNGLYYPRNAPWFPEFKRELMTFPAGANDDQVDALGLIGQVLDKMIGGNPKGPAPEKPKVLSMDPSQCTVTLEDLFEANDRKYRRDKGYLRIH